MWDPVLGQNLLTKSQPPQEDKKNMDAEIKIITSGKILLTVCLSFRLSSFTEVGEKDVKTHPKVQEMYGVAKSLNIDKALVQRTIDKFLSVSVSALIFLV